MIGGKMNHLLNEKNRINRLNNLKKKPDRSENRRSGLNIVGYHLLIVK